MTPGTIERLFKRLKESYKENGYPQTVRLIWHGGEPLTQRNSFYYRIMDLQSKIMSDLKITVTHSVQTNLLLLDKDKIKMFRQLLRRPDGSFTQVGTSIDPVPGIRRIKGDDYLQRWQEKTALLLAAGLHYGAICVVHNRHLDMVEELYDYFAKLYQKDGATTRFNPLYNSGRAKFLGEEIHLSPRKWGQFMVNFYKIWSNKGKLIPFRPFKEYDHFHVNGGLIRSCEVSGNCMNHQLGLNTDGSLYLCGRAIDENVIRLGHLQTSPLIDIINHSMRNRLRNRLIYLKKALCGQCRWWDYCHGGCPNESLAYFGTFAAKSHWCAARRIFLDTIYGSPRIRRKNSASAPLNYQARLLH
jgi:uncharacterized protein